MIVIRIIIIILKPFVILQKSVSSVALQLTVLPVIKCPNIPVKKDGEEEDDLEEDFVVFAIFIKINSYCNKIFIFIYFL